MDLIRKIMLACEAPESGYAPQSLAIDGYTDAQIGYHVVLLGEAGLLDVIGTTHMQSGPTAMPQCVTWAGHDFIDSIRDDSVWAKVKGSASSAGGWTVALLGSIATAYLKQKAMAALGITPTE